MASPRGSPAGCPACGFDRLDWKCASGGFRVVDPELVHADGRRFVWLVSQSDGELAVKPTLATDLALRTLAGDPVAGELVLPPFRVGVYELIGP